MTDQDVRFWERVDRTGDCWLWTGSVNDDGYGTLTRGKRSLKAHRYAWELATDEALTPCDTICHACDVPNCTRTDEVGTYRVGRLLYARRGHLYKATQPINVADRDAKGRGHWSTGTDNGTHTHPERVPRGERNGWAKLTVDAVIAIRARYAAGEGAADLADEFGLADRTVVFGILRRIGWAHVPGPSYAEIKAQRAVVLGPAPNAGPCRDCGTTERRRIAKGLCNLCYSGRERRAKDILPSRGANHHGAKLTDADVLLIRNSPHIKGVDLARQFGVSVSRISTLRSGKGWTHLSVRPC